MPRKTWRPKSKGEARVYDALKLLGNFTIQHEVPLGDRLRLDFLVPSLGYAIEIRGTQHDVASSFFHDDISDFNAAQRRDEKKRDLCRAAGWTYLDLPYKDILKAKSAQDLLELIVTKAKEEQPDAERRSEQSESQDSEEDTSSGW